MAIAITGCSHGGGRADLVPVRSNPALEAAIAKAKAGLPGFLDRLKNKKEGEQFVLVARFPAKGSYEFLYVDHLALNGKNVGGILAQEPVAIDAPKSKGDKVEIEEGQIVDWMIRKDAKIEGGYTQKVLGSGR